MMVSTNASSSLPLPPFLSPTLAAESARSNTLPIAAGTVACLLSFTLTLSIGIYLLKRWGRALLLEDQAFIEEWKKMAKNDDLEKTGGKLSISTAASLRVTEKRNSFDYTESSHDSTWSSSLPSPSSPTSHPPQLLYAPTHPWIEPHPSTYTTFHHQNLYFDHPTPSTFPPPTTIEWVQRPAFIPLFPPLASLSPERKVFLTRLPSISERSDVVRDEGEGGAGDGRER